MLSELLNRPLAALRHPNTAVLSCSQQMTTHLVHVTFFSHHPIVSTAQQELLVKSQRPEGSGHQSHNAVKLFRLDYCTAIGKKVPRSPSEVP